MRYSIAIFAVVFLIGCSMPCFLSGQTVQFTKIKFSRPKAWEEHQHIEPHPDGRQMCFSWEPEERGRMEFGLVTNLHFSDFKELNVSMAIELAEGTNVNSISIRLRDKEGETFSYPIPLKKASKQTLEWKITPNSEAITWGDKRNRKLDFPVSFDSMCINYAKGTSGQVQATEIRFHANVDKLQAVWMDLGREYPVCRLPDDGSAQPVFFYNGHAEPLEVDAELTVEDAYDRIVFEDKSKLSLPGGGSAVMNVPAISRCGLYTVKATLRLDDGSFRKYRSSFAVFRSVGPTAGRAEGFLFGIQSQLFWIPPGDQARAVRAAARIGVKVLRNGTDWRGMQRIPHAFDFEQYERTVNLAADYGLELESSFCYTPNWAVDPTWEPFVPPSHPGLNGRKGMPLPEMGAFRTFVREIAKRYGTRVRFFEVWNEPELPHFANFSPEDYVTLIKAAREELDAYAPGVRLMNGGYSGAIPSMAHSTPDYVERTMKLCDPFVDYVAFHGHGSFGSYVSQIAALKRMMARNGIVKPWYANETAMSAIHNSELVQAVTLFQKVVYTIGEGGAGYTWHNLRCNSLDQKNPENLFGLLNHDFSPRADYVAYNTVCGNLKDAVPLGRCLAEPNIVFRFRTPTHHALTAWTLSNRRGLFWMKAEQPVAVDIFGNELAAPLSGGFGLLQVSGEPVLVRDTKGEPTLLEEAVALEGGTPGEDFSPFNLRLSNPTGRTISLGLKLLPHSLKAQAETVDVQVPPGGTVIPVQLAAVRHFGEAGNEPLELGIEWTLNGVVKGLGSVQCHRIPEIKVNDGFDAQPLWKLGADRDVISLIPAAPNTVNLMWKGKEDCSAEYCLAATDEQLQLQVMVHDDRQSQPFTGSLLWKGDSVQLMMLFPGRAVDWEFGFAKTSVGDETCVYRTGDFSKPELAVSKTRVAVKRDDATKITQYDIMIPWSALGMEGCPLEMSFNLIVNDNDEGVRETILSRIREYKDTSNYHPVRFVK
ncbi:MAG: hypothetical protein J6X55_14300 [Victivallales bacterium]|nr:hypothetical protein [Victivallales bacterium]